MKKEINHQREAKENKKYYCLEGFECSKEYAEMQAKILRDLKSVPVPNKCKIKPNIIMFGTGGEI